MSPLQNRTGGPDLHEATSWGLNFMHTHYLAHRDIGTQNIMMDARNMYLDGFHGALGLNLERRIGERGLRKFDRLQVRVRYLYINFGLSTRFASYEERNLVQWTGGMLRACPDPGEDRKEFYDPFKAHV